MMRKILLVLLILPILLIESFLGFQTFWGEKILPGISAGTISISQLTQVEAAKILESASEKLKTQNIKIQVDNKSTEIQIKELGLEFEIEKTVKTAYSFGHSKNLWTNFLQTLSLARKPINLKVDFVLAEQKLDEILTNFAKGVETPIVESKLEVKGGKVHFTPGAAGLQIPTEQIKNQIFESFAAFKAEPVTAALLTVKPEIPAELGDKAVEAAAAFIGKKLILAAPNQNFEISENEILTMVSPKISPQTFNLVPAKEKVAKFVKNNLDVKISTEPVDAKFQFDGKKVTAFQPSVDGVRLDIEKTAEIILATLGSNFTNLEKISLPVSITPAKIKTADVNNLGISELIGQGVSNFAGSAQERIHNIKLAASRINGTLLAPSQVFSFNQTVGEISTATGYTSAYIISKGRTILGEGGGVCQVSTTAFRAVVAAGLEIVDRRAHAYRVRYYEQGGHQVGLDATIFIPSVDFKFKNDTANNILIQAYTKGVGLYFDFYGTKDGRTVEVSKPVVTNVRPAPSPLYEEDPTLAKGVTKQVDFAAIGANVEVKRTVKKDGLVLHSDKFLSNYKPWQAIFKVGTGG